MSIDQVTEAANKGIAKYKSALKRNQEDTNAYNKGLDYIIDQLFDGDMFGTDCQRALDLYNKATC